jgi:hypothetical protein
MLSPLFDSEAIPSFLTHPLAPSLPKRRGTLIPGYTLHCVITLGPYSYGFFEDSYHLML